MSRPRSRKTTKTHRQMTYTGLSFIFSLEFSLSTCTCDVHSRLSHPVTHSFFFHRSPFARVSNRYVQFVAKVMAMSALAYATHRFWNDMTPFQWDVCLTFIMCVRPLTTFVHACRCLLRLSLSVCAHLRSFLPTDIAQVSQSVLPARHVRSHRFHLLRRPTRASMLLSPQYQQRHTTGDRSIIVLMVPMCYLYA